MKACTLFFFLIISTNLVKAQISKVDSTSAHSSKLTVRDFKNQGEKEDYEAAELFRNDYKTQFYKRYTEPIIINGDTYNYNDKVLTVQSNSAMRAIFEKGIFYPEIIAQSFKYLPKTKILHITSIGKQKTDTVATPKKVSDNISVKDSLTIYSFEELKFLEKSPKTKRFRFWLFNKGLLNPIVYFMELTNDNATSETTMSSFIDGAKLTFFEEGWVII